MTHDSAREVIAWWLGKAYPSGAGQFDLAHDLLTALQSAGYAVVPVEPTEAMLEAALNESGARVFAVEAPRESGVPMDMDISEAEAEHFNNDIKDSYRDTYRAMLTASDSGQEARGEPRSTKTEGEG